MRKYQQLCLIVISLLSVVILLIYRSENNRLKYVLEVVNFFGRSDASTLVRLNETDDPKFDFANPLPVWQRIGKGFFAYSAHWRKYNLMPGGEVTTLVVGLTHAIVSFKCDLKYSNGTLQRGKFGFTRETSTTKVEPSDLSETFIFYRFICKVPNDLQVPNSIQFTDVNYKSKHHLQLREMNPKKIPHKLTLTACLSLVKEPMEGTKQSEPFVQENHLLEYFFHHHLIGIDEFLVYDAGYLNPHLIEMLTKHQIRFSIFPFNFPFSTDNYKSIRQIIKTDCLMRTKHFSTYTMLTEPNEFLYTKMNFQLPAGPLKTLKQFLPQHHRFDLETNVVCISPNHATLIENRFYTDDNEAEKFSLYHSDYKSDISPKTVLTKKYDLFVHRYTNFCATELHDDWRVTVGKELLQYIDFVNDKVKTMLTEQH